MKRIITLLALVCLYTTLAFSQKKYELVIEKTDGTEITVNSEDIVRTYFRVNGSNKTDYELAVEKKDGTEVAVHTALIVRTYYREREALLQCSDGNHPHMIDLGLPSGTKWACCNVGASKPENYGNFYAWGETQPKSVYDEITYQYVTGTDTDGDGLYDRDIQYQDIGSDIAGTSYDTATANWGAPWRMPTNDQCEELCSNCTSEWTTQNGVNGRRFTGPNGGTIFFPAPGMPYGGEIIDVGEYGFFWSSTRNEYSSESALNRFFDSTRVVWNNSGRYQGNTVRPVR